MEIGEKTRLYTLIVRYHVILSKLDVLCLDATVSDNQQISVCYEFQIAVTSKKMVSCLSTV